MLVDRVRVEQAADSLEPEDLFSEALAIFPDETRDIHGDPGSTVVYQSRRFGDIRLGVADPSGETERKLFAHYVWNASLLLAELISGDESWTVVGENVLELGSGLGLGGITALLCGAKKVVLSDYPSTSILENIYSNLKRNVPEALQNLATVHGHEWGDFTNEFTRTHKGSFTRIFAADCFWMPWEHENLILSMLHFLSDVPGARIFAIAGFHTGRAKLAPFFDAAQSKDLELVRINEIDVEGKTRPWQKERDSGKEDVTGRKRWVSKHSSRVIALRQSVTYL